MPYRFTKSKFYARRPGQYSKMSQKTRAGGLGNRADNYSLNQTGGRRHEFIVTPVRGNPLVWEPEALVAVALGQMQRAFNTADEPPTPTAGNNYQAISVMNGSTIGNYKAKIRLSNNSGSTGAYIDVYTIELSFYEALIWDTVNAGGLAMCDFDQVTADRQGEVSFKNPLPAFSANLYKNFKFTHHYMKHRGTIFLTTEDGGGTAQGEINFNIVPGKVRRMQTGAFWGVILHNDSVKNNSDTIDVTVSTEFSFMEYPTENRLPYIY